MLVVIGGDLGLLQQEEEEDTNQTVQTVAMSLFLLQGVPGGCFQFSWCKLGTMSKFALGASALMHVVKTSQKVV